MDCNVQKPYVYNHTFTAVAGSEFFVNGLLCFPASPPRTSVFHGADGCYRTIFGPCVGHTGVIYGVNNNNVSLAFRRLTAARVSLECDIKLQFAQRKYVQENQAFLRCVQQLYSRNMPSYFGSLLEGAEHYADPHKKKQLRIQAWEELIGGDYKGFVLSDRLWLKKVLYKMKKDEYAKPGKFPRMIGDLGVAASLQGFRLVDLLKHVMADHPLCYKGGEIAFCLKPEPTQLAHHFKRLLTTQTYYFLYFSDDACFSVRHLGQLYTYNLDISSCDASHHAIFDALLEITPPQWRHEMQVLVDQCALPISIFDVDCITECRRVVLKPHSPRLYSGSTITTFINNLANILICHSIVNSGAYRPVDIIAAARKVGYVVTVQPCTQPEDIQFLKHSPVFDTDGQLRAMLNLGVLLRSSGQCKGDLPGRGDLSVRARRFQGAFLRGMYPRTNFRLLAMLMNKTLTPTSLEEATAEKELNGKVINEGAFFTVTPEAMYKRYRMTTTEIEIFDYSFGSCGYEDHFNSSGADKILNLDYGLNTQELQ